jgi:hypothetical protein
MRRLRTILANATIVVLSVVLTLVAAEIVLRFLPVAWAPAVYAPTADDPIQRYAPNATFTWSLGPTFYKVVRSHTNAQGFVADYDYDSAAQTPLVAVVGDSFIEAMQVPYAQSVTGLMQRALGQNGRAYAFAQSGAALSQYAAFARYACEKYRPQRLVVSVVGNDFDESMFEHRQRDGLFNLHLKPDGAFDWTLSPLPAAGLVERVARNSALALYLARNIGIRNVVTWFSPTEAKADEVRYVGNTSAQADEQRTEEGRRVIEWFLDNLPKVACLPPDDIVLTVDAARPEIYSESGRDRMRGSYFALMRTQLITDARSRGFKVVDLEPAFIVDYNLHHENFENPTDNHWNEHGHAVVAAAVLNALEGWPPLAAAKGIP